VERYVEFDRARFWTLREGVGPAMVLLHGGPGGTFHLLHPLVDMVKDLVEVFGYDQRASGRSTGSGPFTVARWIADLERLRTHWGVPSWIVGGHSFGAAIGLAYATEHPERMQGLVFMSCLPALGSSYQRGILEYRRNRELRIPHELRDRYGTLQRLRDSATSGDQYHVRRELVAITTAAEFANPDIASRVLPEILDDLERTNWEVNNDLGGDHDRYVAAETFVVRLRRLDVPALLLHGDHDFRPMWALEELEQLLPAARLVRIHGAGHLPWLEQPDEVRTALRAFLTRIGRDRPERI
jgi:proline iminopeptidase